MSRVRRIQNVFDQELAAQGLCRTVRRQTIQTNHGLAYVSREVVIKQSELTTDLTPWWKRKVKKTSRRK